MKILYLLVTILLFSCSEGKHTASSTNERNNPWMDAFKDHVFFFALKEAYKNDTTIFHRIQQKDALNPYDGLTSDHYLTARKLGENFIRTLPRPTLCENCGDTMNYYMASSLHYYNSKELDAVATKLYRQHKKFERRVKY